MANARHTMGSVDWHTPLPFVRAARQTMLDIDLDPATSEEANRVIGAPAWYTEEVSGLGPVPWVGRIFLNPPGGLVKEFWFKLIEQHKAMNVRQAIWIGYSLEQLQTLQNANQTLTPLDFPMCVPNRRIAFVENEARRMARQENCRSLGKPFREKLSPTHANYITYIGPNEERFATVFAQFGQVRL